MPKIAPNTLVEKASEELPLGDGLDDSGRLADLGKLGAQVVIQRRVEDEVTRFLNPERYQRRPDTRGSRNGLRGAGCARPRARLRAGYRCCATLRGVRDADHLAHSLSDPHTDALDAGCQWARMRPHRPFDHRQLCEPRRVHHVLDTRALIA